MIVRTKYIPEKVMRGIIHTPADMDPITPEELKNAYDKLEIGKVIEVLDYRIGDVKRMENVKFSEVSFFNDHIIQFDNGLSATVGEYAMYLRKPHYPLGWHWS